MQTVFAQAGTLSNEIELSFIDRYANCPVCNSSALTSDFSFAIFGLRITWDRCEDCTLVFQNPRLTEESIRLLYEKTSYFGNDESNALSGYSNYEKEDHLRIAHSNKRISKIKAVSGISNGKLLDVGSASGFFGVSARSAGFDVTCVEPDARLSTYARDHYKLNAITSPFEGCVFEPNSFDAVTLWGTDSHFLHPLQSFEKIASVLRPGGVFAMNYQSFDHWIRIMFPKLKVSWNVMYNLTDRSFDVLMNKVGLSIVHRQIEWQTVSLDHLLHVIRFPSNVLLKSTNVTLPCVSFRFVVAIKNDRV